MSEEDKKLLLEMKSNCLEDRGTSRITYNDEKRIKKAKAIDNALKEIERLNKRINKAIEYIEDMQKHPSYCDTWSTTAPHDIICILKGSDKK